MPSLAAISRYPLKSGGGESLAAARVEPCGLAGDRRWMVVEPSGRAVTARTDPRLLRVRAALTAGGLRLATPGRPDLEVPRPTGGAREVRVFGSTFPAAPAEAAADDWLSDLLGRPVALVHQADPAGRPTDPAYSQPGDVVSTADGYPLLAVTEASLAALNDAVLAGPHDGEWPLPVERFRPNLVVRGGAAWAEDGWRRLRIGGVAFRAVKGCARCVLTMTDPQTGERGREPIATLARIRRWDGATWFGVNLVPDGTGTVAVGDEVEVLETVDADGPLR